MSCSSCNNNVPLSNITLNKTCGINVESTWITNTDLVKYTGNNLSCIGVSTNDTITVALQDINTSICPENIATVLLDTIESNPQYVATFANFVNQTIIDCTTTTSTSTSTSTTTSTTTSNISTTTTTTTSACHTTTTTTTSILTAICLGYSVVDCSTAYLTPCTTYYVTNACAVHLTPGCQIYINQNLTPAPAGYYYYNGTCYTVGTGGTITSSTTSITTSTTTSSTTTKTPFGLCYTPLTGGSCTIACTSCFTSSTTTSTTTHAPGAIVYEGICGPFSATSYQNNAVLTCCGTGGTAA